MGHNPAAAGHESVVPCSAYTHHSVAYKGVLFDCGFDYTCGNYLALVQGVDNVVVHHKADVVGMDMQGQAYDSKNENSAFSKESKVLTMPVVCNI